MNIGFTGTRYGMTDEQKVILEGLLPKVDIFRHGSCCGADVEAARIVDKTCLGVKIIAHPGPKSEHSDLSGVDDETMPEKAYFARNRDIVNLSDELYAAPFTNKEEKSGGTWYTINYCRKVGKKVTIIWPNGGIS